MASIITTRVLRSWTEAAGNRRVQENVEVQDGVATVVRYGPKRVEATRLATDGEIVQAFLNGIESSPVIDRIGDTAFGWRLVGRNKIAMVWTRVKQGMLNYVAREASFEETLLKAKHVLGIN